MTALFPVDAAFFSSAACRLVAEEHSPILPRRPRADRRFFPSRWRVTFFLLFASSARPRSTPRGGGSLRAKQVSFPIHQLAARVALPSGSGTNAALPPCENASELQGPLC